MLRIDVLDHGYLSLVESWGSDEAIIEAARMSTAKGFIKWTHYRQCDLCGEVDMAVDVAGTPSHGVCHHPEAKPDESGLHPTTGRHKWRDVPKGDAGLLRFLWENKHSTPFEVAGLTIEVQAPIFVFREWHRHRTQSYSEMSARYTPLPDTNYVPSVDRLLINSKSNKQAGTVKGADELTVENATKFQNQLQDIYNRDELIYKWALAAGVPKELARVHLPVGRYSRMRASANLRNWLAFLTLRMALGAQWEIRQYANALGDVISRTYPRTWELFAEGKQP
jgi:thymidylate synthase (FAD)